VVEITSVGPHEIRYEADAGFFHVTVNGSIEEAHANGIIDTLNKHVDVASTKDALFVTCDVRNAKNSNAKARNVYLTRLHCQTYAALSGANFAFRAVFNLLVRAVALRSPGKLVSTAVAGDEEARAWLAEHKGAYLGRHAKS